MAPSSAAVGMDNALTLSLSETLISAWLAGSGVVAGVYLGRTTEVRRLLRRASVPTNTDLRQLAEHVARQLGVRMLPAIVETRCGVGPAVAGLWRPKIYLPESVVAALSPSQLEAMLAHELAHVRRRDHWAAHFQLIAVVLWWWHPAVWLASRQLGRYRERACDEEVVATLPGKRRDYAECFLRVLEAQTSIAPLWGLPAVRPVELTRRRLEEIMTRTNMNHRRTPWWCWGAALVAAVVTLPGPILQAQVGTSAEKRSSQTDRGDSTTDNSRRPPTLLKYGDGKADGKKSYGGSGHLIQFTLPDGAGKVRGIKINGSRYGYPKAPDEDFEINFLSEDFEELLHSEQAPYRLFKRGREVWVRVQLDKPVELPKTFWVALDFHAHRTKGVYVSYDTSTEGKHSRVGRAGDEDLPKETDFQGDWMVQVLLERPQQR